MASQRRIPVEEIEIKVPYGKIAAKWWGPKNIRPILMLHGWQDNAGSFDTLIPLLPRHLSYLVIDFPGHGLSSRYPHGFFYSYFEYIFLVENLRRHFKWERLSLIAHSMGAIIAFVYAAVFPKHIDLVVGLDSLKPQAWSPAITINTFQYGANQALLADARNQIPGSEPPAYTPEVLVEKVAEGNSVDADKAQFLLTRGVLPSTKSPGNFYFSRDSRVKFMETMHFSQAVSLELARRISVPYLFIRARGSSVLNNDYKPYVDETLAVMKKKPNFRMHYVEGTHHVHLNNPERLAGFITDFLLKYRSESTFPSKL